MSKNEKRLYMENGTSQSLVLLYIVGNTIFTIFYVNHMFVTSDLGRFVLLNIALSLIAFLMAVRLKTYVMRWAYFGIVLAIFQLLRLFWIPVEITNPMRLGLQLLLIGSAGCLFAASVVCIKRATERQNYIIENNIDLATLQQ
jgi:hypothetical protein